MKLGMRIAHGPISVQTADLVKQVIGALKKAKYLRSLASGPAETTILISHTLVKRLNALV